MPSGLRSQTMSHMIHHGVLQELVVNRYLPRDGGVGGFRSVDGDDGRGRNEASEQSTPSRRGRSRTNLNAVDSPAVKDGWLVSEGRSAPKRGKTLPSAPAAPPTSSDDPIAISDTDDEASFLSRPLQHQSSSSLLADLNENDIVVGQSGKRARSSASVSVSATADTDQQAGGRRRSRVRKAPSVLEWPPMSIVMTTYGPGIVLRTRKNHKVCSVCECGCVFGLQ